MLEVLQSPYFVLMGRFVMKTGITAAVAHSDLKRVWETYILIVAWFTPHLETNLLKMLISNLKHS